MRNDSLELVEVLARRRRMVAHGRLNVAGPFLTKAPERLFSKAGSTKTTRKAEARPKHARPLRFTRWLALRA
jgi:hypothetical protein